LAAARGQNRAVYFEVDQTADRPTTAGDSAPPRTYVRLLGRHLRRVFGPGTSEGRGVVRAAATDGSGRFSSYQRRGGAVGTTM